MPGLGAKPIIDIIVAVRRLAHVGQCIQPLQGIGYEYLGELEIPGRHFFRKPPGEDRGARTHHLHMVEYGSDFWEKHLLFRDYLRAHPKVAREYYELKKELVAKYGSDRETYTGAKTSFIEVVVTKARVWKMRSDSRA